MEFLIFDFLIVPIGWLAFVLKYRKRETRKQILKVKYENSYSNVAKEIFGKLVLFLLGGLLIAFVVIMFFLAVFKPGSISN